MSKEVVNNYEIPNWAGKPVAGLHLDVMKEGKMIQKLMIDEKKYYFFGRNKEANDFQIDHQSCSRVHAVLLWHKHLLRPFLVDLGSAHGTFIGNVRLESNKPQQVFIDSEIKFGASTRQYVIRERPQAQQQLKQQLSKSAIIHNDSNGGNSNSNALPETEDDVDNLTEFNTALNKRIAQMVDITDTNVNTIMPTVKKKRKSVVINEEEQIINPEDVDPSVGRFRNLVQTTIVIPNKKRSSDQQGKQLKPLMEDDYEYHESKRLRSNHTDDSSQQRYEQNVTFDIAAKLGIKLPDLAPDVQTYEQDAQPQHEYSYKRQQQQRDVLVDDDAVSGTRKKKYAKEAWPGRKPTLPISQPLGGPSLSYSLY